MDWARFTEFLSDSTAHLSMQSHRSNMGEVPDSFTSPILTTNYLLIDRHTSGNTRYRLTRRPVNDVVAESLRGEPRCNPVSFQTRDQEVNSAQSLSAQKKARKVCARCIDCIRRESPDCRIIRDNRNCAFFSGRPDQISVSVIIVHCDTDRNLLNIFQLRICCCLHAQFT